MSAARARFLLAASGVLACVALPSLSAGPAGAADEPAKRPKPSNSVPPGVKKLWSEYPVTQTSPRSSTDRRGARTPARDEDDSVLDRVLLPIGLVLAGFLAVLSLAAFLGVRPARASGAAAIKPRPRRRARRAQRSHPVPQQPQKGQLGMKNVRRLLDFGGKRGAVGSAKVATAAHSQARPSPDPQPERSKALSDTKQPGNDGSPTTTQAQTERGEWTEIQLGEEGFAEVGERVGAVLTSAQQAAEQIRESARQEAARIRTEASDTAAATIAEASLDADRTRRESEELRGEADRYSKETREAADRYGLETRRKLDDEAAERRAEVEEQARRIRQAAEQKAKDLVTEAVHRQKALVQEAGRSEARLQQLLGVFRGMTSQLEELVKAESEPATDTNEKGAKVPAEGFEEALKPQRTPSRRA
jgi:cell division septum initiation protein DivIVA